MWPSSYHWSLALFILRKWRILVAPLFLASGVLLGPFAARIFSTDSKFSLSLCNLIASNEFCIQASASYSPMSMTLVPLSMATDTADSCIQTSSHQGTMRDIRLALDEAISSVSAGTLPGSISLVEALFNIQASHAVLSDGDQNRSAHIRAIYIR
jgi:hypothetical protein